MKYSNIEKAVRVESRVDNIIAHNNDTEGNSELIDIRTGADGYTYDTAGEAVRNQLTSLLEKSFTVRNVPENTTTFMSLKDMGVYNLNGIKTALITDNPTDGWLSSSTTTLMVIKNNYTGGFTTQIAIQPITDGERVWTRIINVTHDTVYRNWRKEGFNYVWSTLQSVKNTADSAFNRHDASDGLTLLSSLTDLGCYSLWSNKLSSVTDAPQGLALTNNAATLYNFRSTFYGGYVTQFLQSLNGDMWFRIWNRVNNTLVSDWVKILDHEFVPFKDNCLAGKKLVTAGDSYTAASFTGDYAGYAGKNYGYYIAQRNNMQFVNLGINNSTMGLPSDISMNTHPFCERYTDVPTDTDYLIIWFGINDASKGTLGTINDETDATFCGAYNKVLRYYLTNYPFMKVLLVVTTGAGTAFREAIRNIAKKWGYPYLDWDMDYSIPAFFTRDGISNEALELRRTAFGYYGPVNAHPNPQWHEYASTIFENQLRSI